MSLDLDELRMIVKAPVNQHHPHNHEYAAEIIPLVEDQHLLLVTLLLSNAAAMEALPIFLDKVCPSPLITILMSVTLVLFFGEVIPQALCTAYGLAIGAKTAPAVRVLIKLPGGQVTLIPHHHLLPAAGEALPKVALPQVRLLLRVLPPGQVGLRLTSGLHSTLGLLQPRRVRDRVQLPEAPPALPADRGGEGAAHPRRVRLWQVGDALRQRSRLLSPVQPILSYCRRFQI